MIHTNILICGAGIIGLTLARELCSRGINDIVILESEAQLGMHASGRNSGVLHAGIYYEPDTLRGKTCLTGNLLMKEYCQEKGLPLHKTGKVIVAKHPEDLKAMEILHERASSNGSPIHKIDAKELAQLEPLAKTSCNQALYSPETAVVEPKTILNSLKSDLLATGKVKIFESCPYYGLKNSTTALTSQGEFKFNLFINAAGLNSDRVAHSFNLGFDYTLVPFKGIYHQFISSRADKIRGNIYPVPDIRNPFLGVHYTRGANGNVYLGPTSIPAFGRKNYGILKGVSLGEIPPILRAIITMFIKTPSFRNLALEEPRKYLPHFFYKDAKELLNELSPNEIKRCDKVGIRHQLIDKKNWTMIMDFKAVQDEHSFHILNAISPGFTSSMSLAKILVDDLTKSYKI